MSRNARMWMVGWLMLHSAGAAASGAPDEDGRRASTVGEVIVTATRREESLQEVATAITAVGAQDIADLDIGGVLTAGTTAPNVYVKLQAGTIAGPEFAIRGVVSGNFNFQVDSGIGLYVDGVYLGRPGASAFDVADLERVEVLRGPQGTLFGRNAVGGAINLITAGPTGELGGKVEIGVGNFAERRIKGTLNLPAWNGLSLRVTAAHHQHDGYQENTAPTRSVTFSAPFGTLTTSRESGDEDVDSVLVALRYTGVENLTLDYRYDRSRWKGSLAGRQLLNIDPADSALVRFGSQPALGGTAVLGRERLDGFPLGLDTPSALDVDGHSLTAQYAFTDSVFLKYIGAYRSFDERAGGNGIDGNAFVDPNVPGNMLFLVYALRRAAQHQQSHELQLVGSSGAFDWIGGLFYFDERGRFDNPVMSAAFGTSSFPIGGVRQITDFDYLVGQQGRVNNSSSAAFAHLTWHATERLELGGGARHSSDRRLEQLDRAGLAFLAGPPFIGLKNRDTRSRASFSDWNFDVSAKYRLSDTANAYARAATGHVSGGVLLGTRFSPEKMRSYEVGVKSELLERTLRLNVAAFHQRRADLQVGGFDVAAGGNILINAGRERDSGLEIEATFVPSDRLLLNGSYGYTNVAVGNGVRTVQPKHTGYLGAQYQLAQFAGSVRLTTRIDANWRSESRRIQCPIGSTQDPVRGCGNLQNADAALDDALVLPSQWLLAARVSLEDIPLGGGVRGRASLWTRNLTNNDDYYFLFTLGNKTVVGAFERPRTYGLDFSVEF